MITPHLHRGDGHRRLLLLPFSGDRRSALASSLSTLVSALATVRCPLPSFSCANEPHQKNRRSRCGRNPLLRLATLNVSAGFLHFAAASTPIGYLERAKASACREQM